MFNNMSHVLYYSILLTLQKQQQITDFIGEGIESRTITEALQNWADGEVCLLYLESSLFKLYERQIIKCLIFVIFLSSERIGDV